MLKKKIRREQIQKSLENQVNAWIDKVTRISIDEIGKENGKRISENFRWNWIFHFGVEKCFRYFNSYKTQLSDVKLEFDGVFWMPLLYEILGSTYKKNDVNDHKSEANAKKRAKRVIDKTTWRFNNITKIIHLSLHWWRETN